MSELDIPCRSFYDQGMKKSRGHTIPLSLPRRWIGDLLAFSQKVPTVMAERTLKVKALALARRQVDKPPSWCALITKAVGLVSARIPEFRRSYLRFPSHRLYEHPCSVAAIAINREYGGEPAVFLGLMQGPETLPLAAINAQVHEFARAPVEEIGCFRRLIRTAKLPRPLRRILWWYGLNVDGKIRSKTFGTFGVNSIAALGGRVTQSLTPNTILVYYGALQPGDELTVWIAADHRVLDGSTAGRGFRELERILNHEMVTEVMKSGTSPQAFLEQPAKDS